MLEKALILSFPFEIFYAIGEFIDDEDDFLALRMVCHEFDTAFRQAHHKSIYSIRRVFYTVESFENLLKISRHPSGMNKYVREIEMSRLAPYRPNTTLEARRVVNELRTSFESEGGNIKDIVTELVDIANEKFDDILSFEGSGERIALLSLALTGFPSLRSIHLERDREDRRRRPFSRSELNLFFPTLGFTPGSHIYKLLVRNKFSKPLITGSVLMSEQPGYDSTWNFTLPSLLLSGVTHLETLGFHEHAGLSVHAFNLFQRRASQFKSALLRLKALRIHVGLFQDADMAVEEEMLDVKFKTWLETIGSNLEVLWLGKNGSTGRGYSSTPLPVKTGLPKLRRLTLDRITLSRLNLEGFLDTCKSQLEYLRMQLFAFEGDQPTECYLFLRYLRKNCVHLREIDLRFSSSGGLVTTPAQQYSLAYASLWENIIEMGRVIPDLFVGTKEGSVFNGCDWTVSLPGVLDPPLKKKTPVNEALCRFGPEDTVEFWDFITDGKWRSQENSQHYCEGYCQDCFRRYFG
ncbi:hypothetical protein TWF718_002877 [Orbilia javanica]|uniref:F-box domain-containing protein n=1 Tax=Orbilia javanica TaxID=47235 RepID=A0AAN8R988_9PEZI